MYRTRLCYVTFDCSDLNTSYKFWSQTLTTEHEPFGDSRDESYRRMRVPNSDLRLVLQLVPDVKTTKTPVHICIECDDVNAEAQRLIDIGATIVDQRNEFDLPLCVLADPFGNEFCLIQPSYPALLENSGITH